jgi:hypothetical protein
MASGRSRQRANAPDQQTRMGARTAQTVLNDAFAESVCRDPDQARRARGARGRSARRSRSCTTSRGPRLRTRDGAIRSTAPPTPSATRARAGARVASRAPSRCEPAPLLSRRRASRSWAASDLSFTPGAGRPNAAIRACTRTRPCPVQRLVAGPYLRGPPAPSRSDPRHRSQGYLRAGSSRRWRR